LHARVGTDEQVAEAETVEAIGAIFSAGCTSGFVGADTVFEGELARWASFAGSLRSSISVQIFNKLADAAAGLSCRRLSFTDLANSAA